MRISEFKAGTILVDDEPASDFRVVEFIGFERLKTEKDN